MRQAIVGRGVTMELFKTSLQQVKHMETDILAKVSTNKSELEGLDEDFQRFKKDNKVPPHTPLPAP
eukprot:COSAG05_NODE_4534_length_1475_cov_0.827762_1_plen_66_part_00